VLYLLLGGSEPAVGTETPETTTAGGAA
jgi:hypothetical protein